MSYLRHVLVMALFYAVYVYNVLIAGAGLTCWFLAAGGYPREDPFGDLAFGCVGLVGMWLMSPIITEAYRSAGQSSRKS